AAFAGPVVAGVVRDLRRAEPWRHRLRGMAGVGVLRSRRHARHAPAAGALRDRRRGRRRNGRRTRSGALDAGRRAVKFDAIRRRVERSEQLVEGRALQTGVRAHALKSTWRASWTPTRIILAGLAA